MSEANYLTPLGCTIKDYQVLAKEAPFGKWLGADLLLRVPPVGRFFVNVVTAGHFENDIVQGTMDEVRAGEKDLYLEDVEAILNLTSERKTSRPFILNDEEITDEVLDTKFVDRVVARDLGAAMVYFDSYPEDQAS